MASVGSGSCLAPSTGSVPVLFTEAVKLLTAAQCAISESWIQENTDAADGDWFDFIVAGGSTSAGVLASRLSENSQYNVLLLEPGDNAPVESIIPQMADRVALSKDFNSFYQASLTNVSKGLASGVPVYASSKILGGSTSLNNMAYLRGLDSDYRQWYDTGAQEWHPDTVKKYFKKIENLQDALLQQDPNSSAFYGNNGPLIINRFNSTKPRAAKKVLESYAELGIKTVNDLNSANLLGAGTFTANVNQGRRVSAATAYLNNAKNLKVLKNTQVTKVVIDKDTKLAYGVEAIRNGKKVTYYANLEVVISAGGINSPILLMQSGIGAQKTLLSNKIDFVVNSPAVGQNFITQVAVPVVIYADEPKEKNPLQDAFGAMRYIFDRTGIWADIKATDTSAFFALNNQSPVPDFQSLVSIFTKNSKDSYSLLEAYQNATTSDLKANVAQKALYFFQVVLLHPLSRGTILPNGNTATADPVIRSNIFANSKDLDNIVAGLKTVSSLVNTAFFKSINAKLGRLAYKDCDGFDVSSDDYLRCIALNFVTPIGNPVGTAKMGKTSKDVVDGRLLVRGIGGLRVVDESVFPTVPSAVSEASAIMVAERAADMIKEDNDSSSPTYSGDAKFKRQQIKDSAPDDSAPDDSVGSS